MADIAITGSTGFVGRRVAQVVSAAGVDARLLVRDPRRAPQLAGTEVFAAAYEQVNAVRTALEGVHTAFMVSVTEDNRRLDLQSDFVAAAAQAGVRHIVYLSFSGADPDSPHVWERDHALTEELLADLDFDYTILRSNHFDSTLLQFANWGNIQGPAGSGRLAPVARIDVADAIAAVLLDPAAHLRQTYHLTGPTALSLDEVASIISQYHGTECRYIEMTEAQYRERLTKLSVPQDLQDGWTAQYLAIAAGKYAPVTDHVERLAGHPPRHVADSLLSLDA